MDQGRELTPKFYFAVLTRAGKKIVTSSQVFDDEAKANYAYKGNEWVGFDDPSSVIHKTKWIKDNGYAGGMIWSMDLDDFRGWTATACVYDCPCVCL